MSYVSEKIRYEFESVPIELKSHILEKNVELQSLEDLINALNNIMSESETPGSRSMKTLAEATLCKLGTWPSADDSPVKVTL